LSHSYFQWLPRAFILAELCTREKSELVDRAWNVIDNTLITWSKTTANFKNGIMLRRLMAKASAKRQSEDVAPVTNLGDSTTSPVGQQTNVSAQYSQDVFVRLDPSSLTDIPFETTFLPWNEAALPPSTILPWSMTAPSDFSDLDYINDPIYAGEWNHVMTDFGSII
jgi:hypothetical protein